MVSLANSFVNKGFKVDLVVVEGIGVYFSSVDENINIVNFGKLRVHKSLRDLINYLKTEEPNFLISSMGHLNLIALLSIQITDVNTKIIVTEHNHSFKRINPIFSLKNFAITYVNKILYKKANSIIAVSKGVAKSSATKYNIPLSSIKVIYNPVVSQSLLLQANLEIKNEWLKINKVPFILGVGRLTKQKDFASLIKAFSKISSSIIHNLVILGDGELKTELIDLIEHLGLSKRVYLLGFANNPYSFMKMASLFVLSSAWEGLPTVLIEAMACGTPVVSTNCPSGPSEILEDGKWGRLVPVGDVEALAKAMLDTLTETEHSDVASRAAYFSVERATDEYLMLLLPDLNQ